MIKMFLILLLGISINFCSDEYLDKDNNNNINKYSEQDKIIELPEDLVTGTILSIEKVAENEYILLDFSYRALFHFSAINGKVTQVGNHGEGPGEYRVPILFKYLGNEKLSFTDVTNSFIKIIDFNGNLINQIEHTHGGGRQFVIHKDMVFIRGNLTHNLHIYDLNGNHLKDVFPIKFEYKNQIRHIDGGGLSVIDNKIYVMNSIEPVIFVYDINTNTGSEYFPKIWKDFNFNDGFNLMEYSVNELGQIINEVVIFQKINYLKLNDNDYVVVHAKKDEDEILYLFNGDIEYKYNYIPNEYIIGFDNKKGIIFERNINSESKEIKQIRISINN